MFSQDKPKSNIFGQNPSQSSNQGFGSINIAGNNLFPFLKQPESSGLFSNNETFKAPSKKPGAFTGLFSQPATQTDKILIKNYDQGLPEFNQVPNMFQKKPPADYTQQKNTLATQDAFKVPKSETNPFLNKTFSSSIIDFKSMFKTDNAKDNSTATTFQLKKGNIFNAPNQKLSIDKMNQEEEKKDNTEITLNQPKELEIKEQNSQVKQINQSKQDQYRNIINKGEMIEILKQYLNQNKQGVELNFKAVSEKIKQKYLHHYKAQVKNKMMEVEQIKLKKAQLGKQINSLKSQYEQSCQVLDSQKLQHQKQQNIIQKEGWQLNFISNIRKYVAQGTVKPEAFSRFYDQLRLLGSPQEMKQLNLALELFKNEVVKLQTITQRNQTLEKKLQNFTNKEQSKSKYQQKHSRSRRFEEENKQQTEQSVANTPQYLSLAKQSEELSKQITIEKDLYRRAKQAPSSIKVSGFTDSSRENSILKVNMEREVFTQKSLQAQYVVISVSAVIIVVIYYMLS